MKPSNADLWDIRAALGATSGSQDLIAAELERRAILGHISDGQKVLDVGCGTGQLVREIVGVGLETTVMGWDASEAMVIQASRLAFDSPMLDRTWIRICFVHRNILDGPDPHKQFDIVITQRCIINCGDWSEQQQAIRNVLAMLVSGGTYVMCECSADGLAGVNELRAKVDLPAINAPAHNRYLLDREVFALSRQLEAEHVATLTGMEYPLSTYALLSRVVNAFDAHARGKEPGYDAPINKLALVLPSIGQLGQQRLWLWRRL